MLFYDSMIYQWAKILFGRLQKCLKQMLLKLFNYIFNTFNNLIKNIDLLMFRFFLQKKWYIVNPTVLLSPQKNYHTKSKLYFFTLNPAMLSIHLYSAVNYLHWDIRFQKAHKFSVASKSLWWCAGDAFTLSYRILEMSQPEERAKCFIWVTWDRKFATNVEN